MNWWKALNIPHTADAPGRILPWKAAIVHATLVSVFVGSLFYYWFGIANRYIIFLYFRAAATPFDERTSSRYLVAGLVAAGAVMVIYTPVKWYLSQLGSRSRFSFVLPPWWLIWCISALPLAVSIIVMTRMLNQPILPLSLASTCAFTTLISLALALLPADMAVRQPVRFRWLAITGAGLTPSLLMLRAVELPMQGLSTPTSAFSQAFGWTIVGAAWLLLLSWAAKRRHNFEFGVWELFFTGIGWGYLFLPLMHYLFLTPPAYRYISVAANFFAVTPGVQAMCLFTVGCLAWLAARLQRTWN